MANLASRRAQKRAIFFPVVPKFTPRKSDRKGALNMGAHLRQSLPAAGIIEESESARGERGRVGQGRVGFRV